MVRESRDLRGAEKKLTTHLLARHEAIVRADEHVLLAAEVDAARLKPGGILKASDDLLHLLGGHLRRTG